MTHVGERMKLLNCVSQDVEALAKILASAPRAVSKYRANVPDHLSGHCKMAAGSGLGTRLGYARLHLGSLRRLETSFRRLLPWQRDLYIYIDRYFCHCK